MSYSKTEQTALKYGYDLNALWTQADLDRDGKISGAEAVQFFPRFQVPKHVLKEVWDKSVGPGQDGITRENFSTAMDIIFQNLPPSSRASPSLSPSPSGRSSASPVPMVVKQNTGGGDIWFISPNLREQYESEFSRISQGAPSVSGMSARNYMMQFQLDIETLKHIWYLSDIDKDGNLDKAEFCIALHLLKNKSQNKAITLPQTLPPSLASLKHSSRPITPTSNNTPINTPPQSGYGSYGGSSIGNSNYMGGGMNRPVTSGEVNSLLVQTQALNQDMFNIQQHLNDQRIKTEDMLKNEEEMKKENEKLRAEIMKLRQEKNTVDAQAIALQSRVELLQADNQSFISEIEQLKQEIPRLEEIKRKAEEAAMELDGTIHQLGSQIQSEYDEVIKLRDEILKLKQEKDEAISRNETSKQETDNIRTELDNLRSQYRQLSNEVSALESSLAQLESTKAEYSNSVNMTNSEIEQVKSKKQSLQSKLTEAQNKANDARRNASSSPGNKIKVSKLNVLTKRIEDLFTEFNQVLNMDSSSFGNSKDFPESNSLPNQSAYQKPNPVVNVPVPSLAPAIEKVDNGGSPFDDGDDDDDFFGRVKTSSPTPPTTQPTTLPTTLPTTKSPVVASPPQEKQQDGFGFGDDDDGFDAAFGEDNFQPTEQPKTVLPPPPLKKTSEKTPSVPDAQTGETKKEEVKDSFDSFDDFGAGNSATKGSGDPWDEFSNNNSTVTNGLDDAFASFGFGDSASANKQSNSDATESKPSEQVASSNGGNTGFDDAWGDEW